MFNTHTSSAYCSHRPPFPIAGYANCEDMKAAKELYDVMNDKNEVTWVAMIAGYGKLGNVREARRVFDGIPVL